MNMSSSENKILMKNDNQAGEEIYEDIYSEVESDNERSKEAQEEQLSETKRNMRDDIYENVENINQKNRVSSQHENQSDGNNKTEDAHESLPPMRALDKQMKMQHERKSVRSSYIKDVFSNAIQSLHAKVNPPMEIEDNIYMLEECEDPNENHKSKDNRKNINKTPRKWPDLPIVEDSETKDKLRSCTLNKIVLKDQSGLADTTSISSDAKVKHDHKIKKHIGFKKLFSFTSHKSHGKELSEKHSGDINSKEKEQLDEGAKNSTSVNDKGNWQNLSRDSHDKHGDSEDNVKTNQKGKKGKDKRIRSKQSNEKISTLKGESIKKNRSLFHPKAGGNKNKVGKVGKYPEMTSGDDIRFSIGEKCLNFKIPMKTHMPDLGYSAGDRGNGENMKKGCFMNLNTEDVIQEKQENGKEASHGISPNGHQDSDREKLILNAAKGNRNSAGNTFGTLDDCRNGSRKEDYENCINKKGADENDFEDNFYEIIINTKKCTLNLKFTNKKSFPNQNPQLNIGDNNDNDNNNQNNININNSPDEISSEINPGIKKQRIESINNGNETNGEQIEEQGSETTPYLKNVHPLTSQPNPNGEFNETL